MVEATNRLIDACRLNPSSGGGGGGCRSAGGRWEERQPGGFVFSFTFSSLGLYSNTGLVVLGVAGVGVYVAG